MPIQKNASGQKLGFVMVDKTDFATPETGITVAGVIRKDGGVSATLSNTVSELTNGQYVVTLSQSETNAKLLQFRLHDSGASCADQFITEYTLDSTADNQIDSILDIATSILADTGAAASKSELVSNIWGCAIAASLIDDIASILTDTGTTLDNQIDSILADTGDTLDNKIDSILGYTNSILADTSYFLTYCCGSVDSSGVTSILDLLKDSAIGLDIIETVVSDILSTLDDVVGSQIASILIDTATISNITGDSAALSDIKSQLDNELSEIASSIDAYADNGSSGISEIKSQLANATYGLDALETIVSDILGSMGTDSDKITSILADTKSLIVDTSDILSTLDNQFSDVLSTIDKVDLEAGSLLADTNSIMADVSNVISTLDNQFSDVLSTLDGPILSVLDNKVDSVLDIVSDIKSNVSNVISTLDGNVDNKLSSILTDTSATLDNKLDSILEDTKTTLDDKIDSILAEMVTTHAEPGQGNPLATTTRGIKIDYLYKAWRNLRTSTNASKKLYNDDGVTVDQKRAIGDDGTTYTEDEVITGP